MKVLIIEDEPRAANRLARLIAEVQPDIKILDKIPSVAGAVDWLDGHSPPDLIFMDVRLEDGDSFEILSQRKVDSPIIFCTAYSEYALQAFGANSIDYLLKPVVRSKLVSALEKYQRFSGFRMASNNWPQFPPERSIDIAAKPYRQQFLVALAGQFTPVRSVDLVAAKSYLKGTQLVDRNGKQWVLDDALAEIEGALDPAEFMRVSRQWLARLTSIKTLSRSTSGYTLALEALDTPIRVSRGRVKGLKQRLAG